MKLSITHCLCDCKPASAIIEPNLSCNAAHTRDTSFDSGSKKLDKVTKKTTPDILIVSPSEELLLDKTLRRRNYVSPRLLQSNLAPWVQNCWRGSPRHSCVDSDD
jgi:hypothetical protein